MKHVFLLLFALLAGPAYVFAGGSDEGTADDTVYERPVRPSAAPTIDPRFLRLMPGTADDAEFASFVNEVVSDAKTDREKALRVHDWITKNLYYNLSRKPAPNVGAYEIQKIRNARIAVCGGFTVLFAAMTRFLGIPTKEVFGSTSAGPTHFWNEIFLDGRWVTVDTTWDTRNTFTVDGFDEKPGDRMYFDPAPELIADRKVERYI